MKRTTNGFHSLFGKRAGLRAAPLAACLGLLGLSNPVSAQTWTNLGGSSTMGVAVADRLVGSSDHLDIYTIFSDRSVRVNTRYDYCSGPFCETRFTGWTSLGGVSMSPASAVGWSNHQEVFVLGTDFNLWHQANDGGGWPGFSSLGGPAGQPPPSGSGGLCSKPSAVSWAAGRIDVFAMGCDYHLWHTWYSNGWNRWEIVPGSGRINSYPTATSSGSGKLDVVVTDSSGAVWDASYNGQWSYTNTGLKGHATISPSWIGVAAFTFNGTGALGPILLGSAFDYGAWNISTTEANGSVLSSVRYGDLGSRVFYLDSNTHISYHDWAINGFTSSSGTIGTDSFSDGPVAAVGSLSSTSSPYPMHVVAVKSDGTIWYTYMSK